jgi:hypothetical protein
MGNSEKLHYSGAATGACKMTSNQSAGLAGGVDATLGLAETVKEQRVVGDGFLDELLEQK